jgi:hypothetical protein
MNSSTKSTRFYLLRLATLDKAGPVLTGMAPEGYSWRVKSCRVTHNYQQDRSTRADEAGFLYLYRYLTRNRGVALCDLLFYVRLPFPRLPRLARVL